MPTVRLLKPVRHNGEDLVPGDEIPDLDERAASRLVRMKAAERTDTAAAAPVPEGLSDEEVRQINAMKKPELLDALKEACVTTTGKETVATLKQMLSEAWAEPLAQGGETGT